MMKIRQNNYVSNCIDAIYTENETEMSWSIGPSLVCDKIKQDNDMTDCTGVVHIKNENELWWSIKSGTISY